MPKSSPITASTGNSETGITYDKEGNLLTLIRGGAHAASLSYDGYTGNQLTSVKNSGVQFRTYGTYDANGNAPSDGLGNNITYNLLDLTASISAKSLAYTYDADGTKLRKISGTTATDYIGGIQYDSGAISFVQTEEGRALNITGTTNYEYTLTDQLGNTRVTFDSSHGGNTAMQANDYYPFGLVAVQSGVTSPPNDYLYNKKELQEETGFYDYGARQYDPVIGRWTTPDPLAEISRRFSPYIYVKDNPIRLIDPDGMFDKSVIDQWEKENNDANGFVVGRTLPVPNGGGGPTVARSSIPATHKPKGTPKLKNKSPFANVAVRDQGTITSWPPPADVNYQDFGNPSTSLAIGNSVLDTYGAVAGVTELKTLLFGADIIAVNGETAATKLGRAMHALYKAGEADEISTFEEYRLPSGKRIDFLDTKNGIIYELKPNNSRAIIQGQKQLQIYMNELQSMPEFKGIKWKTVLDVY